MVWLIVVYNRGFFYVFIYFFTCISFSSFLSRMELSEKVVFLFSPSNCTSLRHEVKTDKSNP